MDASKKLGGIVAAIFSILISFTSATDAIAQNVEVQPVAGEGTIKQLEADLTNNPQDGQTKLRLVTAYIDFASHSSTSPENSLRAFASAIFFHPQNEVAREGFKNALGKLGKDPKSAAEVVSVGDSFAAKDERRAAAGAYMEALRIRDDAAVWKKYQSVADAKPKEATPPEQDVDFGPYMADLQRKLKSAWVPPPGHEKDRIIVSFKVHSDGHTSGAIVERSSGYKPSDDAAMKALKSVPRFRPLPKGAPSDVDIQFTFDYSVFQSSGGGKFRRF